MERKAAEDFLNVASPCSKGKGAWRRMGDTPDSGQTAC
jgi:hypothetical protein